MNKRLLKKNLKKNRDKNRKKLKDSIIIDMLQAEMAGSSILLIVIGVILLIKRNRDSLEIEELL